MNFDLSLTKEDWITFNMIYMKYSNKKSRLIYSILGSISLLLAVFSTYGLVSYYFEYEAYFSSHGIKDFLTLGYRYLIYLFGFIALSIYFFLSFKLFSNKAIKKTLKNSDNKNMFQQMSVMFNEEEIIVSKVDVKSIAKWISITKVIETKNYIALFLNSSSCLLFSKNKIDESIFNKLKKTIIDNIKVDIIFINS